MNDAREREEIQRLLSRGFQELGYSPEPAQLSMCIACLEELKKWNRAYNLTGIRKDADMVVKHLLDSFLYLKVIPAECSTVADVGSGAGFPGIPMQIMRPQTKVYLIEPSGKKAAFLRHVSRVLGLAHATVIEKRVEETCVGIDIPEPVDVVVTRALFDIGTFVKKTSHIVRKDGLCVVSKGPKVHAELAQLVNMHCEVIPLALPLTSITRHMVVVSAP